MATYTCNACGLAECTICISRDEIESAKLIHTATCPVYGDSIIAGFSLDKPEHYHMKADGYPVRYKDEAGRPNRCLVCGAECPTPELDCLDCKIFEKDVGTYTVKKMRAIRENPMKHAPGMPAEEEDEEEEEIFQDDAEDDSFVEDDLDEPEKINGVWRCPLTNDNLCDAPELAEARNCEKCEHVLDCGPADTFTAAQSAIHEEIKKAANVESNPTPNS